MQQIVVIHLSGNHRLNFQWAFLCLWIVCVCVCCKWVCEHAAEEPLQMWKVDQWMRQVAAEGKKDETEPQRCRTHQCLVCSWTTDRPMQREDRFNQRKGQMEGDWGSHWSERQKGNDLKKKKRWKWDEWHCGMCQNVTEDWEAGSERNVRRTVWSLSCNGRKKERERIINEFYNQGDAA